MQITGLIKSGKCRLKMSVCTLLHTLPVFCDLLTMDLLQFKTGNIRMFFEQTEKIPAVNRIMLSGIPDKQDPDTKN